MYPFEIHLTTQPLPPDQLARFVAACAHLQAKPLVIELARGEATTQPMLSKVVQQPSLAAALAVAAQDAEYLRAQQLPTMRLKIETPVAYRHLAAAGFTPYFEWHGKVAYQRAEALLVLCQQHRAHLSANALKGEAATRFVTLREFGGLPEFEARVAGLATALAAAGWPLRKQEAECCLYDSNTALDAGWLPL